MLQLGFGPFELRLEFVTLLLLRSDLGVGSVQLPSELFDFGLQKSNLVLGVLFFLRGAGLLVASLPVNFGQFLEEAGQPVGQRLFLRGRLRQLIFEITGLRFERRFPLFELADAIRVSRGGIYRWHRDDRSRRLHYRWLIFVESAAPAAKVSSNPDGNAERRNHRCTT